MIREEKVIILLCTTMLILFGIELGIKTMYSTKGERLETLTDRIIYLQKENIQLENKILVYESFRMISSEAKQDGFIPAKVISF